MTFTNRFTCQVSLFEMYIIFYERILLLYLFACMYSLTFFSLFLSLSRIYDKLKKIHVVKIQFIIRLWEPSWNQYGYWISIRRVFKVFKSPTVEQKSNCIALEMTFNFIPRFNPFLSFECLIKKAILNWVLIRTKSCLSKKQAIETSSW